jgi:hypothetical protein
MKGNPPTDGIDRAACQIQANPNDFVNLQIAAKETARKQKSRRRSAQISGDSI